MTKLTLAFALMLTAAAAAHAQGTTPAGTPLPPGTSDLHLRKIKDPVHLDEALINASRNRNISRAESVPHTARNTKPPTFDAKIKVKNSSTKFIESVDWTATLLDPETGAVIRSYAVTSKTRIAPGKSKKLSEKLEKPGYRVVSAVSPNPHKGVVADLKVKVTSVTYADGSTSTTP